MPARFPFFIAAMLCALVVGARADEVSPAPTPTATPTPASRSVRLSFLPPPMEGTISLGIYDAGGKLVRVLHRESEIADFDMGADALHTKWDGTNDAGQPLPAGKYSARGFVVGDLRVEDAPAAAEAPQDKVLVKLVENPLSPSKKGTVTLTAGFDEDGTFLQTADGLPLFTVDETPEIFSVALAQRPDKSLIFSQNDGDSTDSFRVTRVDQMMEFDCGGFELK